VDNSARHRTAATKRREATEIGRRGVAGTPPSRPAVLVGADQDLNTQQLLSKRVSRTDVPARTSYASGFGRATVAETARRQEQAG